MVARANSASAGLLPVTGTWGQVRIGSLLQGSKGTNDDVWEVVDMRHPAQFDYKTTPWFRIKNLASQAAVSVPPRSSGYPCTFMVPEETVDPDVEKPKLDPETVGPASPLSDGDAVALLIEKLSARVVATQDHETKVWHCLPYEQTFVPRQDYIDHIEVAHGIDLSAIKDGPIEDLVTIHGNAHSKNYNKPATAAGGFPHVHDYKPDGKPFGDLA